ncbi:MAG: exosortase E/protease, VPEID-CTERM system [Hyphomicrobium sp.]
MLRARSDSLSAATRIGLWAALLAVELILTRLFAPLPDVWNIWPIIGVANAVAKILFLSLAIFVVISWPKRAHLVAEFSRETDRFQRVAAGVSVAAVLLAFPIRAQLAEAAPSSAALTYIYAAVVIAATTSLILASAPLSFWRTIVKTYRTELVIALSFGAFGLISGEVLNREGGSFFSEENWAVLSSATLHLSYWILLLIDHGAFMDPATRVLGAGDFSVRVFAACSGYEGMMLISAFLAGYFVLFRQSLRFPNVLLLFPLAMAAIWLLNSFRIALLVFIGGNFSPEIALGGFHSQFGWVSFLLVAIVIMTFGQRLAFFGAIIAPVAPVAGGVVHSRPRTQLNPALVYLAPFVALMAGQIFTSMAAPHEHLLYPVKVLAVGGVLFILRDVYLRIWEAPAPFAVLLGGVAGILWIATDPGAGTQTPLAVSLSELSPVAFFAWLVFRGVGTIIMVPIAEELAFRGFLYRSLLSSRFENVDFRAFGFVALAVSSTLFGIMHERWLAAALAGLLYALIMNRGGRISDAIAAHMTTNAVIFAWAVAAGQWSLL